jgi:hypothetical protein
MAAMDFRLFFEVCHLELSSTDDSIEKGSKKKKGGGMREES